MSVSLTRHAQLEDVTVKQVTGIDGQGKPTYGPGTVLRGRVVRKDEVIRTEAGRPASQGDSLSVFATAWFDAAQSPLPDTNWQLTFADGLIGIVVLVDKVKGVRSGALDHVMVKVREE